MLIAEVRELVAPEEDKLRAYPLAVRKDERYRPCGKQQPTPRCNDYWIIG